MSERADAVVVGARCAGSAAATALARAGRRVVALDRARFPADTLSTHLLFPSGVAELGRLGALERVRALGAPELGEAMVAGAGLSPSAAFTPVDGIGHGMCVRRTGLDAALVATAREAGAEVREGVRVRGLLWRGGRVAGVRYEDGDGAERELRAPLVVGADGRRSLVALQTGAEEPYRRNPNGRACYFAYFTDPHAAWRGVAAQWREGPELGTAFPCDGGLLLVLLMPPVTRAGDFRGDLRGAFLRTVAAMPGLAERLEGCEMATKVRSALDTTSYFRRSSGPGWALPGDAGHFKDPVTAQGIRDALRYGRLLGEAAAPVLDDPVALDRALHAWERRRERECLETYQWTNRLGRAEPMTPLEVELYRAMAYDPDTTRRMLDVFSRLRRPSRVLPPARMLGLMARAIAAPAQGLTPTAAQGLTPTAAQGLTPTVVRGGRRAAVRAVGREIRDAASEWRERERARRSPLPPVQGRPVGERPERDRRERRSRPVAASSQER